MAAGLILSQPPATGASGSDDVDIVTPESSRRVWFVGVGAGVPFADLSLDKHNWIGLAGGVFFGRIFSDELRVAVGTDVQTFSILEFDPVFGSSPPDDTIELWTLRGSVFLTPNWEPVPLLGLLSGLGVVYFRTDIGYTKVTLIEGVGDVTESGRIVRTFDGDKDGLYLHGGFGLDLELNSHWMLHPELSVEYHQFSGWYILAFGFGFYCDLGF